MWRLGLKTRIFIKSDEPGAIELLIALVSSPPFKSSEKVPGSRNSFREEVIFNNLGPEPLTEEEFLGLLKTSCEPFGLRIPRSKDIGDTSYFSLV